jgi:hypothetical protein
VNDRYYVAVILVVGINALAASPGTIFSVTGTFPLFQGSLVVSTNPWSFTFRNSFYAKAIIFPWTLISNKPVLSLGSYNSGTPITVSIDGLPSTASVTMIVPGSLHPWTIGMRNALISS